MAYAYKIAKNDTIISQYAEFLNAVAKTDTCLLYNANMTTRYITRIRRSGVFSSFTYSVKPGSANKQITYVKLVRCSTFRQLTA